MLKARNKKGFTLAETLIVVAIIAVLAAIAFIGIITHMRSMTKLEYDKYAKEIFIAAQNHLSMAAAHILAKRTRMRTASTIWSSAKTALPKAAC